MIWHLVSRQKQLHFWSKGWRERRGRGGGGRGGGGRGEGGRGGEGRGGGGRGEQLLSLQVPEKNLVKHSARCNHKSLLHTATKETSRVSAVQSQGDLNKDAESYIWPLNQRNRKKIASYRT